MKTILAIDQGSTGIRAILFNEQGEIVAREYEKTPAIIPCPGGMEYDPIRQGHQQSGGDCGGRPAGPLRRGARPDHDSTAISRTGILPVNVG